MYRANLHMAVVALLEAVNKPTRQGACWRWSTLCMLATALLHARLRRSFGRGDLHQVIAEFPVCPSGITYLPIPGRRPDHGALIVERVWCGDPRAPRSWYSDQPRDLS